MTILDQIRKTARGAAILKDWLGDGGKPVLPSVAFLRARDCARCARNEPGNWWDKVKGAVADTIRHGIAVKRTLDLKTPYDAVLGSCGVCGCNNLLAPWVPIEHIKKRTPPETIKAFPETGCWKRRELT